MTNLGFWRMPPNMTYRVLPAVEPEKIAVVSETAILPVSAIPGLMTADVFRFSKFCSPMSAFMTAFIALTVPQMMFLAQALHPMRL
jgi:hypothetical protein